MGSARIKIPVSIIMFDVVVDILLVIEEIGQIGSRFVKPLPHLQIDPLKRLVGLCTIGIEVIIDTVIF